MLLHACFTTCPHEHKLDHTQRQASIRAGARAFTDRPWRASAPTAAAPAAVERTEAERCQPRRRARSAAVRARPVQCCRSASWNAAVAALSHVAHAHYRRLRVMFALYYFASGCSHTVSPVSCTRDTELTQTTPSAIHKRAHLIVEVRQTSYLINETTPLGLQAREQA